jgi:hypothetical protein
MYGQTILSGVIGGLTYRLFITEDDGYCVEAVEIGEILVCGDDFLLAMTLLGTAVVDGWSEAHLPR